MDLGHGTGLLGSEKVAENDDVHVGVVAVPIMLPGRRTYSSGIPECGEPRKVDGWVVAAKAEHFVAVLLELDEHLADKLCQSMRG